MTRSILRFPIEPLHRLASHPRVYDLIQAVVGVAELNRRLARRIDEIGRVTWVVDVGGGTGREADLWPGSRYLCLDQDPLKLQGFTRKYPAGYSVLADASRLPIRSQSVDVLLCKNVSHHLPDEVLDAFLGESARVLKSGGRLLFMDAVWQPRRRRSRMLWALDRGSHPRSEATLHKLIGTRFPRCEWERITLHHEYVLGTCWAAAAA